MIRSVSRTDLNFQNVSNIHEESVILPKMKGPAVSASDIVCRPGLTNDARSAFFFEHVD